MKRPLDSFVTIILFVLLSVFITFTGESQCLANPSVIKDEIDRKIKQIDLKLPDQVYCQTKIGNIDKAVALIERFVKLKHLGGERINDAIFQMGKFGKN